MGRHKALVCLPCLIFFIVRRMSGTKREREGKNMKALVSMLLVQVFLTGVELLSRVVLVQGTFIFALLTYRHIVATICIIPFALYFERYNTNTFISFNWLIITSSHFLLLISVIMYNIFFYIFIHVFNLHFPSNPLILFVMGQGSTKELQLDSLVLDFC